MNAQKKTIVLSLVVVVAFSVAFLHQQPVRAQEENVKVQAGENALPFSVETFEGQTLTLDDYQGKVLILDFFASWCDPCQEAALDLAEVRENFSRENLAILSIESDPEVSTEEAEQFKAEYGGDWAFAIDPDVADDYGVEVYPTIFVVGPDGYVAFHNEGPIPPSVLNDIVGDVLGVSAPPEDDTPSTDMIIDVKVEPEDGGGIVGTRLRINDVGEPVFTYQVEANTGYEFAGWTGDVSENKEDSETLEIVPLSGTEVTANFTQVGTAPGGTGGPLSDIIGTSALVAFAFGAVIAACLGVLGSYLLWGRREDEEDEEDMEE